MQTKIQTTGTKKSVRTPHQTEVLVRNKFNEENNLNAQKQTLNIGAVSHEFDLYEKGKIIGGISTSPWSTSGNNNNTAGQDRAATELLWLTLWSGNEKRIHVLTEETMANGLLKRFSNAGFPRPIEILHFNKENNTFQLIGTL